MAMPTDVLRDEHVLILKMLDVLDAVVMRGGDDAVRQGLGPDEAWWARIIAWLRGFADRTHHAKEETLLFPAMERHGVPADGGPIGVMLEEHVEGRGLIAGMEESRGDDRLAYARRYVTLLRNHIDKENGVLFPLADAVLDDAGQQALARAFDAVTIDLGREASQSRASAELDALASEAAVPEQLRGRRLSDRLPHQVDSVARS